MLNRDEGKKQNLCCKKLYGIIYPIKWPHPVERRGKGIFRPERKRSEKMTVKRKRVVSLLLVLCMLFTLFPLTSLAETTSADDTGTKLNNLWAEGAESEARTTFNATVVNGAPEKEDNTNTCFWYDAEDGNYVTYHPEEYASRVARIKVSFTVNKGETAYLSFDYAVSGYRGESSDSYSTKLKYWDCDYINTQYDGYERFIEYGNNDTIPYTPQWKTAQYSYDGGEEGKTWDITFEFYPTKYANLEKYYNQLWFAGYLKNLKITSEKPESTNGTLTVECDGELADLYVNDNKQNIADGKVVIERLANQDTYTLRAEVKDGCYFIGWQEYNSATGEYENRDPQNKNDKERYQVTFTSENDSAVYRANVVKKEPVEVKIVHPGENGEYLSGYDGTNATLQYANNSTNFDWKDVDAKADTLKLTTYETTYFQLVQKTDTGVEAYCKGVTFQETAKSEDDTPSQPQNVISESGTVDNDNVIGRAGSITPTSSGMLCVDLTTKSFVDVDPGNVSIYNVKSAQTRAHLPWTADDEGLKSGNTGKNVSVSVLKLELTGNGRLVFDYKVSSEVNDVLSIAVGTAEDEPTDYSTRCGSTIYAPATSTSALVNKLGEDYLGSGIMEDWETFTRDFTGKDGETFYVYIVYAKDGTASDGNDADCAWVRNIAYVDPTKTATITVVSSDNDMGNVSLKNADGTPATDGDYYCGTPLTVTAEPIDGYVFYGWTVEDATNTRLVSTNKEYTFIVTQTATVTAVFEREGAFVARTGSAFYRTLESAMDATPVGIIRVINDCTLASNATLQSGATLLLPFSDTDPDGYEVKTTIVRQPTIYYDSSLSSLISETKPYVTVTIGDSATLTVSGKLVVGGVRHSAQHDAQGQTSGAYSKLTVNGKVNVPSNGYLDVNGLVNGNGNVVVNSGGEARIPYLILDYAGGANTLSLFMSNTFPFGQYATMNVQCDLTVYSGGKITGSTSLYFFSASTTQDVPLVGTTEGLIQLAEGATLKAEYNADKCIKNTSVGTAKNDKGESYNYLATKDGNISLDPFGKTTITITGGATAGAFNLQGYTSAGMYLNIPYTYDLVLKDGDYWMPYYYRIMPGANLTVDKGATLHVGDSKTGANSGLQAVDGWYSVAKSGKNYPSTAMLSACGFNTNGNLIVNGTLEIGTSATFGGIVSTTAAGATVITGNDAKLTGTDKDGNAIFFGGSTGGYVNNYSEYVLPARIIVDGQEQPLEPYSTYESSSGESKFSITSFTTDYYSTAENGKATWNSGETAKTVTCNQSISGDWSAPVTLTFVVDEDSGCKQAPGFQSVYHLVSGSTFLTKEEAENEKAPDAVKKVKDPTTTDADDKFAGWYTYDEESGEYTPVSLENDPWTTDTKLYALSANVAAEVAAPSVTVTVTSYYVLNNKGNDTAENAAQRFTHVLDGTTLTVTKVTEGDNTGKGYTYLVIVNGDETKGATLTSGSIDTTATYDLSSYSDITSIKIVAILKGDANGDQYVTTKDITKLRQHISVKGRTITDKYLFFAADINGDSSITTKDVTKLCQHISVKGKDFA